MPKSSRICISKRPRTSWRRQLRLNLDLTRCGDRNCDSSWGVCPVPQPMSKAQIRMNCRKRRKGAKIARSSTLRLCAFAGNFFTVSVQFRSSLTLTHPTVTGMLIRAFQNRSTALARWLGLLLVVFIFYGTTVEAAHRHGRVCIQTTAQLRWLESGANNLTRSRAKPVAATVSSASCTRTSTRP